jgi:carboxymethylenebutenolidase
MKTENIRIETSDGPCDAFVAYPDDGQPHPAAILLMDAFGLRPYLKQMAQTLASHGYYVLLPNLFYRIRPEPVLPLTFPLTKDDMPDAIKELMLVYKEYDCEAGLRDIGSFLDYLAAQKEAKPGKVGLTGYCMGGGMALRAAARFPDRIAAAASFHGGNLASDDPNSPHLGADKIKATLYIAHADHDKSTPESQQARLREALAAAGVDFGAELYSGAIHGFTMADLPAYDEKALQRHWKKLTELFAGSLAHSGG